MQPSRPLLVLVAILAAGMALLVALSGLSGCSEPSLASSEVGNPPAKGVIVGALLEESEAPAAGAHVRLYPVTYDPVRDSARENLRGYRDTADADGAFSLSGVDTGHYNVEARLPGKGIMLLLRDIHVRPRQSVTARGGILKAPGAVALVLPDLPASVKAYVFIAGTGVFSMLDPASRENPSLILSGVPAGSTPEILYRADSQSLDSLLAREVQVRPGDTVPASILQDWAHSMRIFLDTGPDGVDVDQDAAHYPVLVRLGKSAGAGSVGTGSAGTGSAGVDFDFSRAAGDGRDIRFTDKAGGPLKFEIESWDSAGRAAVLWVCPGTLKGGSDTQFVRMYWGNSAAATASGPAFSLDLGFAGVWHLQRMEGGNIPDASGSANPILPQGVPPIGEADLKPGIIGKGIMLDGREKLLATGKGLGPPDVFALSLWFKTTTDSGGKLIGFGALPGMTDTSRDRHVWMDDTGRVHFGVFRNSGVAVPKPFVLSAPGTWNDGKWHQMGASLSGSGMALYMDGRKVAEDTTVKKGQVYQSPTGYWRMGADFPFYDWPFPPSARYFKGMLDEVRVAHKAYPASWFKLGYESQREGGRLVRFEAD